MEVQIMLARRSLLSLVAAVAIIHSAGAQTVALTEAPLLDSCVANELVMELKGKIKVQQGDKQLEYPHEAQARHVFFERVMDASGASVTKAARYYKTADGTITFNGQTTKRSLRAERTLLVAHRVKEQLVVYSLKGALSRAELEMTEHFDTLALPALAPAKEVAVGASWKLSNAAAEFLCDLEGLTEHDLTCKLEEVKDKHARVSIAGSAGGIGQGAQVKLLVTGYYDFDLEAKRLVALEWKQSDERQQGPVSPALSADVVIRLTRTPIPEPSELSKFTIDQLQSYETPPANLTNIAFREAKGRYALQHGRDWHVVSPAEGEQLVLRLMDRGKFVAQATITPWKKAGPALTLDEFADLMAKTPGWQQGEVTEQGKLSGAPSGMTLYRVTAPGALDGLKCVQSFYLLIGAQGEQVIVTFSMKPEQVENLRERDLEMVRSFTFEDK
jgi:hypothetical protein